ncbi:MAG: CotH kinase family protein [Bacillota bacterium]
MEFCQIDLGPNPWPRLAEGSLTGTLRWNDGPPITASVQIRGAHSRRFPKRSLQVTFRSGRLPDEPPTGHTIRRLHLNADYVDPTLMRSALSYSLFPTIGVDAPRWRHVALTLSDGFAGIYVGLESVDRDFCLRRRWRPGPIFYAINRNANFGLLNPFTQGLKEPLEKGYLPIHQADPTPLRDMLMAINLASADAFPRVAARWFDLDRYLHWLMGAVFVGNRDGFVHNYALYLEPEERRFRIIPWDYDATWGIDIHGRPARLDRVPVTGWNKLSHRLMKVPAFRERYRQEFRSALDGPLSPDAIHPLIARISEAVGPWLARDQQKREADFPAEVERLKRWAVDRRALLLTELDRL